MAVKVLSKTNASKNYWNTKKQHCLCKKNYLGLVNIVWKTRIAWFLWCLRSFFLIKSTKLWRFVDDGEITRLTSCLGHGRRLRLNRKCNFSDPHHFQVVLDVDVLDQNLSVTRCQQTCCNLRVFDCVRNKRMYCIIKTLMCMQLEIPYHRLMYIHHFQQFRHRLEKSISQDLDNLL